MGNNDFGGPQDSKVLEFERDAMSGVLKPKTIPTAIVRQGAITRFPTMDINKAVGSITASGTAPLRLTYLNLTFLGAALGEYALVDRNGTFDTFVLGTAALAGGLTLGINKTLIASPNAPLYAVQGTFVIYNAGGSVADGTYSVAFSGVQ